MKHRLKEIRRVKGLNQSDFAEKLGISRGHLAGLESGAKNITERLTNDICRIFNVNRTWFTTGEGEMFLDPLDDVVVDDEIKQMYKMYRQLDDNMKKVIMQFIKSALEEK